MRLKNFEISIPILVYKNKVTHFFSRNPVAIEWALIECIKRFYDDEAFKNITIKMFFENILKLQDIDLLVKPCVEELISLGIISPIDIHKEIDCICIKDLQLTTLGNEIIKEGKIPSKDIEDLLTITYSPLNKSIVTSGEKFLQNEKGEINIDLDTKYSAYPKENFINYIKSNKSKFSWLDKNSHIKDIEPINVTTKYKYEKGLIIINEKGELELSIDDNIFKEYIEKNIDIYEILNLAGIIDNNLTSTLEKNATDIIGNIDLFLEEKNIQKNIKENLLLSNMNIIRKVKEIDVEEMIQVFKQSNTTNSLLIILDKTLENSNIELLNNNKIILYIPDDNIIDTEFVYLNNKSKNICISDIKTKYKDDELYITTPYLYKTNIFDENEIIEKIENLINKRAIENIDILIVQGIWKSIEALWREILNIITKLNFPIEEKIINLINLKNKIEGIYNKKLPWKKDLLDIIIDYIKDIHILCNEELRILLSKLNIELITNKENSDEILETLISKINYIKSVKDLEEFYNILELSKINKSSIKEKCLKDNLYNANVIIELKERFEEVDFINKLKTYTLIEERIKDLKDVENKLKKHLKLESILEFYKLEDFDLVSKYIKQKDVEAMINRWNSKLNELKNIINTYKLNDKESSIDVINKNLNEFLVFINKVSLKIPDGFEKVYVLDTNVFIHKPDILLYFRDEDYIVVPKKVIEELDNLKFKKPNLRLDINTAIGHINKRFEKNQLVFEDSDIDLLPKEYEPTPDNMILSVAIKYKNFNTTLISSDKIFSVKASSEDIDNVDLDTFLMYL